MKIFNVILPNTCSRNKRRKNCEESRWRSQSVLVRPVPMPCLNRCQDLIGSEASTHSTFNLIGSCNKLACENIRFSSLFAAGDVSRGGTSATQRQKFQTDDVNQCLHNKSGSHGVPNTNLSNFTCLLVDFGKVLCSSANELQQNSNASSREQYILQILTVLLEILRVYI